MEIYLDNSATTKPYKDVIQAMTNCMIDYYGNPSSIHLLGEKAKKYLKECRKVIADTLKAEAEEIIFTSGGSESNNFLLKGFLKVGDHLITSCIEHSSVLTSCCELEKNGVEVTYLKVDSRGKVSICELKENIKANTKLVSIMHVNNEIGVIQDIEAIGTLIKEVNPNILFHVDAVQSYGKLLIHVNKFKIDLLSISAHKLHGPRGIGAAYIRKGYNPKVLINGGGQEFNLRSGTENLPAIAGFAEAAKIMNCNLEKNYHLVAKLRDYLVSKLGSIAGVKINSCIKNSLPYVLNISATGIRSGKILFYLDERQIYVSKSSACSARKLKDSHVMKALGLKQEDIMGSLRISFSEENTLEQIDLLVQHLEGCLQELRNRKIK
jgi:cysteine desulfurase